MSVQLFAGNRTVVLGSVVVALAVGVGLMLPAKRPQSVSEAVPEPAPLAAFAAKFSPKHCQSLYVNGKKIGYLVNTRRVVDVNGTKLFEFTEENVINTGSNSRNLQMRSLRRGLYHLDGGGELETCEESRTEDGKTYRFVVQRDPKGGYTQTTVDGKTTRTKHFADAGDNLADLQKLYTWLEAQPRNGDVMSITEGAFMEGDWKAQDTKYVYLERVGKLHKVNETTDGITMTTLMDSLGDPTESQTGVFTTKAESEDVARQISGEGIDAFALAHVPLDKAVDDPAKVARFVFRIKGLSEPLPASHRQKLVSKDKDWSTYEIRRDAHDDRVEPLTGSQREEFLRSTFAAQSDAPEIRNLAVKIVGKETDPVKRARLLADYVYNTIESDYDDNSTTALEVLKKKRGDCTESALLFSALARAVDLPTRTISGLMYDKAMETTTKKPSLCMHEWDEIHDGKRWVSVDPAWGQVYVDAMHIKMGNDDKGYGWLSSVGLMEAKVVSVETK